MGPTTSKTSLIVRITLAALSGSFQASCHPTLSNARSKLVVLLKKGLVYQHTDEKDIQAHVEPTCKKKQLKYGNFSKRLHYK